MTDNIEATRAAYRAVREASGMPRAAFDGAVSTWLTAHGYADSAGVVKADATDYLNAARAVATPVPSLPVESLADSGLAFGDDSTTSTPAPAPASPTVTPTRAPNGRILGRVVTWRRPRRLLAIDDVIRAVDAESSHGLDAKRVPGWTEAGALGAGLRDVAGAWGLHAYYVKGEDKRTYALLKMAIATASAASAATGGIPSISSSSVPSVLAHDEQVVRLDGPGSLTFRRPGHLETEIRAAVASALAAYPATKLTPFIADEMSRMRAVSWGDGGGCYFVPPGNESRLDALKRAMSAVGGRLDDAPKVEDDATGRASVAMAASDDTRDVITRLREDIGKVRRDIDAGIKVRGNTLHELDAAILETRETARAYARLAGLELSALEADIASLDADTGKLYSRANREPDRERLI